MLQNMEKLWDCLARVAPEVCAKVLVKRFGNLICGQGKGG